MSTQTESTPSDNERFYDEEIAPFLLELTKKLKARGMSMIATVEFDPDKRGSTFLVEPEAGLSMHMLHRCAHHGVNVDGYMMSLVRFCREKGIDTSASMYLRRFV